MITLPFQIEFDSPFFGMEVAYFRNHLGDASYMREYGSQVMLSQFGLPYIRSRPIRLYLNGDYVGFYTMMEAPTQGYVMQRSFGTFNPALTAMFKVKSRVNRCPYTQEQRDEAKQGEVPDPYYFERGDHRDDAPEVLNPLQCYAWFSDQIRKEENDVIRGFLEYNQTCGLAMVNLGRVDRDYGPKSVEDAMISFLDSKIFNPLVTNLQGSIDTDQWLKNFAAYAVMLNHDSPINNMNNFYLATTTGGENNDWKIFQYDHNNVASKVSETLCADACGNRLIYWPILRPACQSVEDHPLLGRIMNDEIAVQKYLGYVQDFLNVVNTTLLDTLRDHGNEIKEFLAADPLFGVSLLSTPFDEKYDAEAYEKSELSPGFDGYNTQYMPFLRVMEARLEQVQAQLDAIKEGTLPRDGVYGKEEVCPDWRDDDSSGEDYLPRNTAVEGDACASFTSCAPAADCYRHNRFYCNAEGVIVPEGCKRATPFCDGCFPYSRCGSSKDKSSILVENDFCGSDLATSCALGSSCFDHKGGNCAFDGAIITEQCARAELYCKPCFQESRCGTTPSQQTVTPTTNAITTAPAKAITTAPTKMIVTKTPTIAPQMAGTEAPTTLPSTSPKDSTPTIPLSASDTKRISCAAVMGATFILFSLIDW